MSVEVVRPLQIHVVDHTPFRSVWYVMYFARIQVCQPFMVSPWSEWFFRWLNVAAPVIMSCPRLPILPVRVVN